MLITSYKIGEVHFCLLSTNGFHAKAKNERFTAAGSRCRQNLKYENFVVSPTTLKKMRQKVCRTLIFSLFNQLNRWFVALS